MNTAPSTQTHRTAYALAVYSMWQREIVRFWRQKSRLFGALATPLLFWLVLGLGFGHSLNVTGQPKSTGYLGFFFPGVVVLVVLFTAIYSTISVIEDRREGFLQAVLVAPVPRITVILGKALGGTTIALLEGILLIAIGWVMGRQVNPSGLPQAVGVLTIVAFALTALGLAIAWTMESTAGFHGIMNLLLMPMWLLSGAVFPLASAHPILRWLMKINPLTYGVSGFRQALYRQPPPPGDPTMTTCVAVSILFGAVMITATLVMANRKHEAGR